jgi:hypothetical protein
MQRGTQHTEESLAKMRAARVGLGPTSEETKRKISLAKTGKKHSEETKAKIRAAKLSARQKEAA